MSSIKPRIVFRADGNSQIGLGHIVRSISLIEILKNNFECLFISRKLETAISTMIEQYCPLHELHSEDITGELIELSGIVSKSDILVTDGYEFDSAYQQVIKSHVDKLVMVDDKANYHYYADLIINHGVNAASKHYVTENYTKVLTGLPYAIIRKEFLEAAKNTRTVSGTDTAFICLGGSDPFNITTKALSACFKCDFIKSIVIVIGAGYKYHTELAAVMECRPAHKHILLQENISAKRLVELILMCGIAIAPASSVAIEVCSVKAGLLTGTVIDNQEALHKQLVQSGSCISAGDFTLASEADIILKLELLNDIKVIQSIIDHQSKLIDGLSDKRILNIFNQLVEC